MHLGVDDQYSTSYQVDGCSKMINKKQNTVVCQNRKARFEYEILESLECGIELLGSEIKSVRNFKVSIDASYAMVYDSEIWLHDCNIDPYKNAAFPHEPKRKRLFSVLGMNIAVVMVPPTRSSPCKPLMPANTSLHNIP